MAKYVYAVDVVEREENRQQAVDYEQRKLSKWFSLVIHIQIRDCDVYNSSVLLFEHLDEIDWMRERERERRDLAYLLYLNIHYRCEECDVLANTANLMMTLRKERTNDDDYNGGGGNDDDNKNFLFLHISEYFNTYTL